MRTPSAVQIEALKAYARENGRNWKSQLLNDWTMGRVRTHVVNADLVGPLQEVRNQFGPSWLLRYGAKAVR